MSRNRVGILGLVVMIASACLLSGCNTAVGVSKDVSETGAALTRGVNDIKTGL